MQAVRERARAKINLYLHVTGWRADGMHLLESLVVFAECGDVIEAEPSRTLSLAIEGPFGDGLGADGDNLVLRAAVALQAEAHRMGVAAPGAALRLVKSLPLAAGIGGGSADAAATLRALNRLWRLNLVEEALELIGRKIGADIPVCVASRSRLMLGVGDKLFDVPTLPEAWLLLVNPLRGLDTAAVFAHRRGAIRGQLGAVPEFSGLSGFVDWLGRETRNDLVEAASDLQPEIVQALEALARLDGARIARMTGSGATCFALFETRSAATCAAQDFSDRFPGYWTEVASLRTT